MRDLKIDNLENLAFNFISGSKGKDEIKKFPDFRPALPYSVNSPKQGTQEGDEGEFNFGCIVFEGCPGTFKKSCVIDRWI